MVLYDNAITYQSELQEALAAAMERLREAMEDVHKIQRRLGKADFHLGRTRHILRKGGYGGILSKKHRHKLNDGEPESNSHPFSCKLMICSEFQGRTDLQSGSIENL